MIIAAEDKLIEAVCLRLLRDLGQDERTMIFICPGGQSNLEKRVSSLVRSCYGGLRVLVCTDLDALECPDILRARWFPHGVPSGLLFSVAVREADAWLLADPGIARFLEAGVASPANPEELNDAKGALVQLARRSRSRAIREEMVSEVGALAKVGPGYNPLLREFVLGEWDHNAASAWAPSLARLKAKMGHWLGLC